MEVVIAVDAGTTGVRAIAFDRTGAEVASAYRELTQFFPRPGWVEHDATEIWTAVQAVLVGIGDRLPGARTVALGITNQRETAVVWDRRSGLPRHRAIVWQDRRTAPRCRALAEQGRLPAVRRSTGLVLDPYFTATKYEWLFTEAGIAPDRDTAVGTVDAWLLWNLTGGAVHATDVSNASRTLLFDLDTVDWSSELCDLFGVPPHVLPEVRPSSGRLGTTTDVAGLGRGIPVSGMAGDQQASLFGQACFRPGMTKNTYGTGSFVLMNVGETRPEPVDGLLTTVAWQIEGRPPVYAYEGAIFATGSAIQWLRDGLGVIDDAADTGPLASSVPDAGGVVVVPAFTGLGSPWWDPEARGAVFGLTRGTTRAQLARAVVEAMAYQTRDVVEAMADAAGHRIAELRADGGAAVMDLLLQLQADQLDVPVARPTVLDSTARGAAFLAGLAEGFWTSTDEIAADWRVDRRATPAVERDQADVAYRRWLDAVDRVRRT